MYCVAGEGKKENGPRYKPSLSNHTIPKQNNCLFQSIYVKELRNSFYDLTVTDHIFTYIRLLSARSANKIFPTTVAPANNARCFIFNTDN